jgi:hypothetical protein
MKLLSAALVKKRTEESLDQQQKKLLKDMRKHVCNIIDEESSNNYNACVLELDKTNKVWFTKNKEYEVSIEEFLRCADKIENKLKKLEYKVETVTSECNIWSMTVSWK